MLRHGEVHIVVVAEDRVLVLSPESVFDFWRINAAGVDKPLVVVVQSGVNGVGATFLCSEQEGLDDATGTSKASTRLRVNCYRLQRLPCRYAPIV